jgi:hypothetical protein
LFIVIASLNFGAFGQGDAPDFDKVEKLNDVYSIGFKSYDGEFYYNYDPYVITSSDTIEIQNLNGWHLSHGYMSPYGEMASFEISKMEWVYVSDDSSYLTEQLGMLTIYLETAKILNWYTQESLQQNEFLKIEVINDEYSVGYMSHDEEFEGYGEPWILSNGHAVQIDGISANLCSLWNVSPNGKYAVFETLSMGWVYKSENDSILHDRWSAALVDLSKAKVVQYCQMDCGDIWNENNQWVNGSKVIFDGTDYSGETEFNNLISSCAGDLNKDGVMDSVVVTQDTAHEIGPYQLEIYFANSNGEMTLMSKTIETIPAQYPNTREGLRPMYGFSSISIVNGVLLIEIELLRGHFVHKFRYQDGEFELIGYTRHESDGYGKMHFTDFNLMTGARVVEIEYYSTDEPKEVKHTTKWINPLPNLKTFTPFGNELY